MQGGEQQHAPQQDGQPATTSGDSQQHQHCDLPQQQQQEEEAVQGEPALLAQLGVSLDVLVALLTGGAADVFDQPVWMVRNLAGKIKGSYTADKMLHFCRRGTLSCSQLLMGIDRNLPYVTRQDTAFYRRLDELLAAVAAGGVYQPLTPAAAAALNQQGLSPAQWQAVGAPAATACQPSTAHAGSSTSAQLQAALEQLCGCCITWTQAADDDSPRSRADAPGGGARVEACASPGSRERPQPQAAAATAADAAAAPAVASSPDATTSQQVTEAGAHATGSSAGARWLYLNHLGWCRGPFEGAKIAQAHLCGRLPRDTMVAALQPAVQEHADPKDVAAFFRPLGALLDNAANGWHLQPVSWTDLAAHRCSTSGLPPPLAVAAAAGSTTTTTDAHGSSHTAASTSGGGGGAASSAAPERPLGEPWLPLVWRGPGEAPPLLHREVLLTPAAVSVTSAPAETSAAGRRGGSSSRPEALGGSRLARRRPLLAHTQLAPGGRLPLQQQWGAATQLAPPVLAPAGPASWGPGPRPVTAYLLPAVGGAEAGYQPVQVGPSSWPQMQQPHLLQQQQQLYATPVQLQHASGVSPAFPALPALPVQQQQHQMMLPQQQLAALQLSPGAAAAPDPFQQQQQYALAAAPADTVFYYYTQEQHMHELAHWPAGALQQQQQPMPVAAFPGGAAGLAAPPVSLPPPPGISVGVGGIPAALPQPGLTPAAAGGGGGAVQHGMQAAAAGAVPPLALPGLPQYAPVLQIQGQSQHQDAALAGLSPDQVMALQQLLYQQQQPGGLDPLGPSEPRQ